MIDTKLILDKPIRESGMVNKMYQPDYIPLYVKNTYPLSMSGVSIIDIDTLPSVAAIYFVVSGITGLLYIGRARNLHDRWKTHHRFDQLTRYRYVNIAWISFPNLESDHLIDLEAAYIKQFRPPLNQTPVKEDFIDTSGRDADKQYLQVGIPNDGNFARYLTAKWKETGVSPSDQMALYASAHFDTIKWQIYPVDIPAKKENEPFITSDLTDDDLSIYGD